MSFPARQSAASRGRAHLTLAETSRSSSDGGRLTGSARAAGMSEPEPFAIEVQRRDHVTIVQPRGELDIARAIQLSGLDQALPFAAPDDPVDTEPGESLLADRAQEASRDDP